MYFAKPYVRIALVLWLLRSETEGQKACSCYTFEGEMTNKMLNWKEANESCEATKKHLVVMETEREWQFITDEIRKLDTKQDTKYNEWHIGLFNASGNWTWINDNCDITGNKSVCMRHYNVTKPTKTPQTSTTSSHQFTITEADSTTPASRPPGFTNPQLGEDKDDTIVIVAATLAVILFIALIVLGVVLFLRRKRRQSHGADGKANKSLSHSSQPENQCEPIDPAEAAMLLGKTNNTNSRPENEQPEYAMVKKNDRKEPIEEDTTQESPEMDHEYAVVNKAKKKKKEGDLLYAEIDVAEFGETQNDTEAHKPSSYEPTVYADVMVDKADPDSTQPTYTNVQTTGV
ncbi:uncharacterized protein [Porites lutea]|uniref:uncharacterized protein isoform X2 n=1 Tax=Porites lutea TaxID=51062 RepID=UPI003CC58283